MRILALRPEGLVIPFIHASMVRAFRSLGVEVMDLPFPQDEKDIHALKYRAGRDPTVVFTVDLPIRINSKNNIKDIQSFLGFHWIIWFVDDPEGYGFPESCDPSLTIAFCWDREIARAIHMDGLWKGISPVYLPLAADPEVFYPEGEGSPISFPGGCFVGSTAHPNPFLDGAIEDSPGFGEDIASLWELWKRDLGKISQELVWGFLREKTGIELGTLRRNPLARLWVHGTVYRLGQRKRKEIVSRVIGEGGGVFGDRGWEKPLGRLYRGEVSYGEDLRRVYNGSSFVLDIRQPQSRTGLTQRIFDSAACGTPVLADFSPELDSLFDREGEIFTFRTLEEAKELKNLILLDPPTTIKKGGRARKRVLALHTYRNRAREILGALHRFLACSLA
jgi:glycosyltransferase involved in cell wall biosynthesis